jgi:acetyl-CoA acetyltransferase
VNLRDVAVVGIHVTEQARELPDRTSFDITLEAVTGALEDAGLSRDDVDGAALDWPGPGGAEHDTGSWATLFGHPLSFITYGSHDGAGSIGVARAAAAIAAGLCDVVVLGGGTAGPTRYASGVVGTNSAAQFSTTWGSYIAPQLALMARRHMHDHGTTAEQIATVAATIRNNGHVHPEAVMNGRGPYTVEDVLASPVIASPLHRLDMCLVAQGGGAVVLTTVDRARDLRHRPVRVLGAATEYPMGSYEHPPTMRRFGLAGGSAARRAFGNAGVGPDDVDVWCLYDMSSFEVIRQLEALGACPPGEGGRFVEDGHIAVGGSHPVNPDGGCLAHSWNTYQQLTLRVVEAVRQLRGQSVGLAVDGASVAVTCGPGGANTHFGITVLGVD